MAHLNKQLQFLPNSSPTSVKLQWSSCTETPTKRKVFLRAAAKGDVDPDTNHSVICWVVGAIKTSKETTPVLRVLQIVRKIDVDHLTNWGPMTKTLEISLVSLTLQLRKYLEVIAQAEQVRVPDGQWSCQDLVITVLELAEK